MAMLIEIIQGAMPSPELVTRYPAPGESNADLEGVYATWSPIYPAYDALDLLEFVIIKDGDSFPTSYLSLGGGVYKVFSHTGLFPEDGPVIIVASAQTQLGYKSIHTWSFTTRSGYGSIDGYTVDLNVKEPGSGIELGHIEQAAQMSGEGLESLTVIGNLIAEALGDLYISEAQTSVVIFMSLSYQTAGGDYSLSSISPVVGYFGGDTLIDLLVGAPEIYDIGLARFTRTEVMDPQSSQGSLEVADPQESVASMSATEISGLALIEIYLLALLLTGQIQANEPGGGAFELISHIETEAPITMSLETGDPIDGSYPVSVEIQRREGLLIFLDLLSGVLSKLRE